MKYTFVDDSPNENGIYEKSNGGTERMFRTLMERLPTDVKDRWQIVCSRVRDLDDKKKKILWLHDLASDPESEHLADPTSRWRFEKLVFVSNHQFQGYHLTHGVPYSESIVLENAIDPIDCNPADKPTDRVNLIYHTTPHRGLEILVPVFEKIAETNPNVHLDVFSSFSIYGWENRDEPYAELFERCRAHPQIEYHGTKPNDEVREYLKRAHIFAFPSCWEETSCLAAIEAMSAGTLVVSSDYGALPETLGGFGWMYRFHENPNNHANIFAANLADAIQKCRNQTLVNNMIAAQRYVRLKYNWATRIVQWESLLRSMEK